MSFLYFYIIRICDRSIEDGLIISLDDSNGHPQFVGNIGYKVAAQFFHLIGLKDKLFQVTAQGIQERPKSATSSSPSTTTFKE